MNCVKCVAMYISHNNIIIIIYKNPGLGRYSILRERTLLFIILGELKEKNLK